MLRRYLFTAFTFLILFYFNEYAQAGTITQTANPPVTGCPDTFTTSIAGSFYVWDFGPNAFPPGDSGAALQSAGAVFITPGTFTVYVYVATLCCGIEEDSLVVTVHPGNLNISLSASSDSVCEGKPIMFIATPASYSLYSFFINDSLVTTTTSDTLVTYSLVEGDSVRVLGFQGSCYSNPSPALHPTVLPIPAPAFIISSRPNDTICSGDTISFTATTGYDNYDFYNGGSEQQSGPSNVWTTDQLGQGNSVYVIVSNNGCNSGWSNVIVTIVKQTPLASLTVSDSNICQGSSVTATALSAPVGPTTYNFLVNSSTVQNNASSVYISNSPNNDDTIVAISSLNGCPSPRSNAVVLTVHPLPAAILTGNAINDSVCQGSPVTFTASPATDSAYQFYNAGNLVQNGTSPTYTTNTLTTGSSITVIAINFGCAGNPSDTITVTVDPAPAVTAGSNQSACASAAPDTLSGFTPPGGVWTGTGITSPSGVFSPSVAGPGNFSLVYTYTGPNGGCPGEDSIIFNVSPYPIIVITPAPANICQNQSIQLTASGGTTYSWSPAAGLSNANIANPVASPASTTTYTLSVTNTGNCSDTASITVTVNQGPVAAFSASIVCAGLPTDFTNNSTPVAGTTYTWFFGDGTTSTLSDPTHTYTSTDSFQVSLIAQLGNCFDTATSEVEVFPGVTADFSANPRATYNDSTDPVLFTNLSTNSSSWNWNFGDQNFSNLESPSHYYSVPGLYTVTLVSSNQFGCIDSIANTNYITIYQHTLVFIPNAFSPETPPNNILYVYSNGGIQYFDWQIFDRWGEKVYQSYNLLSGWSGDYKGSLAPMGVYTYTLKLVFDDRITHEYKGSITLLR